MCRSEKECSDISIYGSVLVLITSNSGLERGSTLLGQTVYQIMGQAVIKS